MTTTDDDKARPAAPDDDTPALQLRQVSKRYGDRAVLDAVTLAVPRGQTTVLLGPSGTGKSTLLRLAVGLERPDEGSVHVFGEDLARQSARQLNRLRQRLGMLFQDGALFGSLSVGDNIAFPLRHIAKLGPAAQRERVEALLDLVGLAGLAQRGIDELSGGQRKRVALARAIALSPEMVLFDEPTSGLDPQTSAAIDELIVDMRKRLGLTFVVITHDVESCRQIADRVGVLFDGRLAAFDEVDRVFATDDDRVRAFLERRPAAGT